MAAFLISDVTVRDSQAFQIYRTRAAASITKHGGKYLVRGGEFQVLEGSWSPRTIIIVEFPSMELAKAWYRSPEYAFALEVRDAALNRNLVLVDGIGEAKIDSQEPSGQFRS
jgi:uncharacterized protein (DUF1330 family)